MSLGLWCPNIANYDIINIEFQKAGIIILQSESFYTRTLAGKLVIDSYLARTDSENLSSTDRANTLCTGLPFFIVIFFASLMSLFALHLTQ